MRSVSPAVAVLLIMAACGGAPEAGADVDALPAPASHGQDSVAQTGSPPGALVTDEGVTPVAGPQPPVGAAPQQPAQDSMRGTLIAGGTVENPITMVQPESGPSATVHGRLEGDLRALGGAEVLLRGVAGGSRERPVMEVAGYEVLSINGARPWVGRVLDDGRLATATDTLRLRGSVGAPVGALVWVTGSSSGDALIVGSFGVIRHPH